MQGRLSSASVQRVRGTVSPAPLIHVVSTEGGSLQAALAVGLGARFGVRRWTTVPPAGTLNGAHVLVIDLTEPTDHSRGPVTEAR